MSSNLEIIKKCLFCESEFIAKTLVTRYCSHKCNSRHYKKKERDKKINAATEKVPSQNIKIVYNPEINSKDFLSIKETSSLLGISERTIFRLVKSGELISNKVGGRRILKRSDINKLFQ